ncbi:MAG TPA: flavodoxin family protein [Papillibacter sp.]|jgi:multimeric flavodoxin WrbA|nr:flavodoxin family protein [Papillibacter sp.]
MKVLLINGSPHKEGCTYTALREVAGALEKNGIETEIFHIGTDPVRGCTACLACFREGKCAFDDDICNELAAKCAEADGIVVGSPVYFAGPNGALTSLLDRIFYSSGRKLWNKPAAAVVSCRRGGASAAFDRLNKYFTINRMPIVSSQYWNSVHGRTPEDVKKDREGLQTMRMLGENMAWLLKSIKDGNAPLPPVEKPQFTSFADGK